jgi:hypothetical protein
MRQITQTVYLFDELSERAKERARDWFRSTVFQDSSDWEYVYADAERVAALLGIELDRRDYKTVGGATRKEPAIYFSGFSSQGDGACFEGRYAYAKGSVKAIQEYAPKDAELLRIARGLARIQKLNFYRISALTKHSGRYSHAYCMSVQAWNAATCADLSREDEEQVTQLLRDFANWIYRQLEKEYEYQCSDEAVEDNIAANEYEFDENGERV